MRNIPIYIAAIFAVALAAPAGAATIKPSPAGAWQSSDGAAKVRVTLCGDGTSLCAKLTSVAGKARTPENLQLVNDYVVQGAKLAADNSWVGTVHFNGQTAEGRINLIGASTIQVSGCQLGMCKTFEFRRVNASASAATAMPPQMAPRTVGLTVPE